MAKLDLLAVGPANIELGGGWQHNAEVVTRLPKYGFEVAYTPHLFVLPAVISNEDVAKFYRGVLKSMEERGVFVPSLIHDIVEGGRLGPAPLSERLRRVAALTTRDPHGPLRKALIAAQTLLWDPYFPNELERELYVALSRALYEEVGNVKALLSLADTPSDFAITANVFRKPIYQVFNGNSFDACHVRLIMYERLAPLTLKLEMPIRVSICVRQVKAFYRYLLEAGPLTTIWVNPVSFIRFSSLAPEVAAQFKEVHFLYPGNAIHPWALELRSYDKEEYLLFGGHLSLEKGIYDMPYILKALTGRTNIKVLITGSVDPAGSVVAGRLAKTYRNIEFLGFVKDKKELLRIYSRARALIYPSHLDSYSLTLLDSLGVATPVVTYGTPEFVWLYGGLRPVRLVNEFDFRAFAEELARLAKVDNSRELFEDPKTQEFVKLHSSWDNVVSQYAKILKPILQDRKSGSMVGSR